ncbi:MAG: DUF1016 family protein [Bacteroidetes bacterium]|nr:DUF1016 family protein [Bacteroidota bacterium]
MKQKLKTVIEPSRNIHQLYEEVAKLIELGRNRISTAINVNQLYTYFQIGKIIVRVEQDGEERAAYGKKVLIGLSEKLTNSFGKGFRVRNLELMRKFYMIYSKSHTLSAIFENAPIGISTAKYTKSNEVNVPAEKSQTMSAKSKTGYSGQNYERLPLLSWSQYVFLMQIGNIAERSFYEIESLEQRWSYRELKRQFNSALYERLAASRNKEKVRQLSSQGLVVEKAQDILKDPLVLEFLQIRELPEYTETELEKAIIDKLQEFMMELGKGFLFEARQKRISIDDKHHHIDLTFYNRLLKCFVLIDLKIGELTHQDLGQMQMYVNYYDRFIKNKEEEPTIGIVLCKKKHDALVEITLPLDNKQIFAAKYQLYLPDKDQLRGILEQDY